MTQGNHRTLAAGLGRTPVGLVSWGEAGWRVIAIFAAPTVKRGAGVVLTMSFSPSSLCTCAFLVGTLLLVLSLNRTNLSNLHQNKRPFLSSAGLKKDSLVVLLARGWTDAVCRKHDTSTRTPHPRLAAPRTSETYHLPWDNSLAV